MILRLHRVPVPHGSYDLNNDGRSDEMPERACRLAPDVVPYWLAVKDYVVVSDMYRSADSSLAAVRSGRGAAEPGYSGHNFGLSIDIDVHKTMKKVGVDLKAELDTWMSAHGWFCWREDHDLPKWRPRPNEAWHYNFAPHGVTYNYGSCVKWLGAEILRRHGVDFELGAIEVQGALARLRLYSGAIDGKIGPLTALALERFRLMWGIPAPTAPRMLDRRTLRTLAFCTADIILV